MDEKQFKKLVKKDKYQVFLFSSSVPISLNFIVHPWIITINKFPESNFKLPFNALGKNYKIKE